MGERDEVKGEVKKMKSRFYFCIGWCYCVPHLINEYFKMWSIKLTKKKWKNDEEERNYEIFRDNYS